MLDDDARIFQQLLSKLTVDSIRQSIQLVRQADLKTVEINDLKAAMFEMLKAYGCYTKSIKEGASVFRAMRHNANEERFANVSRIYPDPKFLTTLGRANRAGQPIFYLSGDKVIPFHEIKAKPGDVISLLECRPRRRLWVHLLHKSFLLWIYEAKLRLKKFTSPLKFPSS